MKASFEEYEKLIHELTGVALVAGATYLREHPQDWRDWAAKLNAATGGDVRTMQAATLGPLWFETQRAIVEVVKDLSIPNRAALEERAAQLGVTTAQRLFAPNTVQ